jgi:hypothetical protein
LRTVHDYTLVSVAHAPQSGYFGTIAYRTTWTLRQAGSK